MTQKRMTQKVIRQFSMAVLTVALCIACQNQTIQDTDNAAASSSDKTACRMIQHEVGEIQICSQPQKIAVLGPYVLEPLLALGVQPAGYADRFAFHTGDYTNPARQIPYLGDFINHALVNVGTAGEPSLEAILQLQPDLIVATNENVSQYEQLSEISPTLILDWMNAKETLDTLAQAVDRIEQAEQRWSQRQKEIAAAKEAFAPVVAEQPEALLISSSNLQDIRLSTSGASLCHSLLEDLGFQMVSLPELDNLGASEWASLSIEALPQIQSDSIFVLGGNISDFNRLERESFETHQLSGIKEAWEKSAITQSLEVSSADQVYFIPAYLCLGLPGPIGTELYLQELKEQLLPAQASTD